VSGEVTFRSVGTFADGVFRDSERRMDFRSEDGLRMISRKRGVPEGAEGTYGVNHAERAIASAQSAAGGGADVPTAGARRRQAAQRDEVARQRDIAAEARDRAAEARDRAAERQEALLPARPKADAVIHALVDAARAARNKAAADRARAAADRARAAADRARAAEDRSHARVDLFRAHLDDLTGVYTRGWGLVALQHEIDHARRSRRPFVLAFVDVDGLKQINDERGHAEGDAALRAVARVLKSNVRSYDPVVRVGGDEFVCAFSDTPLNAAAQRLTDIKASLEQAQVDVSVSVGLAELEEGESLEELTARGDAALYSAKQTKRFRTGPPRRSQKGAVALAHGRKA
jgi:diguanylate cyclase (GGDEF)-like protein